MSKSFLFFSVLLLTVSAAAQNHDRNYYLLKAKKQKTIGWILLGGGIATGVIGLSQFNFAGSDDGDVNNTPAAILFGTGIVASLVSVPVFKAAKRNKRQAASLSLHYQNYDLIQKGSYVYNKVPSVRLKIAL